MFVVYILYQENTSTDNGGECVQDMEEDEGLRMSSTDNTEVRSEQVSVTTLILSTVKKYNCKNTIKINQRLLYIIFYITKNRLNQLQMSTK